MKLHLGIRASERGNNTVGASRRQHSVLLLKKHGEIIPRMKRMSFIICLILCLGGCAAPGQVATNTPQQQNIYPPVIEDTPERQLALLEAWKRFLTEWRLPEVKPDLMPVLNTPRALPAELAGRININTKPGVFGEIEAKEALRRFIDRSGAVLGGESVSLRNLSLASFTNEGNFFRALFWQTNFPFQLAEGYGELRFTIGKNGELLQMSSTLLPAVSLPMRAEITSKSIYDKLIGREFAYTTIAGQPQSYKLAKQEEIKIGEMVIYPKVEGKRLEIHLALPVVVGRGMTWTVYVDAINGDELGVKQNFAS